MPAHPLLPQLLPSLLAGDRAAAPRTLVDILRASAEDFPDVLAIDSGTETLTYAELYEAASELAERLAQAGIGRGDKVGLRIKSGTTDLYVAILGILVAGAAYVPVDADDPDERARLVFAESRVAAIVGNELVVAVTGSSLRPLESLDDPTPDDDAWVIFTSGSTGKPKGVAVTHRSAAAFVDAESRMFLQGAPIGKKDRVIAGLSVAFDASCEEMWLAWAYGACLVPAPRSLVRSGVDVGPWLVANGITIVSTVPTLVALWPSSSLDKVRLLIMGGEACPASWPPASNGMGARCGTPTVRPRQPWWRVARCSTAPIPCGSVSRSTAGTWPWWTRRAIPLPRANPAN